MDTFEASHCKPGTRVNLYGDDGVVTGHHTERETGIDWVDLIHANRYTCTSSAKSSAS